MALNYTSASDQYVNYGSDAALDDNAELTVLMWVRFSNLVADWRYLASKRDFDGATGARGWEFNVSAVTDYMQIWHDRATTPISVVSSSNAMVIDTWYCVGFIVDTTGVDADQKLFQGTLDTPLTEISTYSAQTVGAGGLDDAAQVLLTGYADINSVGDAWTRHQGDIALIAYWDVALTIREAQMQQFHLFGPAVQAANCQLFSHQGYNGTGTQTDWSGKRNAGAVTGAVVSSHAPLGYAPHLLLDAGSPSQFDLDYSASNYDHWKQGVKIVG